MDEFGLIERLLRHAGAPVGGIRVGPGDDAAVLRPPRDAEIVATTDAQVERVHFEWGWLRPADVGYRCAMACHSDLAAMGARPWIAFSSLAIPGTASVARVLAVNRGLHHALVELGAALGGGNVTHCPDAFSLTLTAIGLAPRGQSVRRTGARPGDAIWCSGDPGLAALGRHQLAGGRSRSAAARAFRRPMARIALGGILARHRLASAMIDISDGLAGDLAHVLGRRLGAELHRDALWRDRSFAWRCARIHRDPEELVLHGGEDYELLFTVSPDVSRKTVEQAGRRARVSVRPIGVVTPEPGIRLTGAGLPPRAVPARGFRHVVARAPAPEPSRRSRTVR